MPRVKDTAYVLNDLPGTLVGTTVQNEKASHVDLHGLENWTMFELLLGRYESYS
jgi:hypothetical protein